jgi:putative ABC transport system permease protein
MPNQFEKVFNYDMQIGLKNGLDESKKQEYITSLNEKTEIEKIVETYITSNTVINQDKEETAQIIVPKEQNDLDGIINLADVKTGQKVELQENEICLTDKAAELLGVKQGDSITLKDSDGNQRQVKISNIVENYVSHYIYMSKTTYENLYGETYSTNVLFTKNNNLSEEQEETLATEIMNQSEVASISRISTVMSMLDDTMKSLNYVVIILIVSAGLLAFVVLYNLSNVNISERIRELATIKVLGFYDKEVYLYVTRETVILTAIGIILGLIGGYFLNYFIIGTCEINILRFAKIVQPISYIYAAMITIGFTLIVNLVTYFALKKIDMIESLKSVE